MKSYLLHLVFFLLAVGSGLAVAYLVAEKRYGEIDPFLDLMWSVEREHAEIATSLHLGTIKAALDEDYETILRWNCIFMRSNLPRLRIYDGDSDLQRKRVQERLERATAMVRELEERGLCDVE